MNFPLLITNHLSPDGFYGNNDWEKVLPGCVYLANISDVRYIEEYRTNY